MTPSDHLERLLKVATDKPDKRSVRSKVHRERLEFVCTYLPNRACVRLLMACFLANIDRPEVDPRRPYTEIGGADCFSGRTYDERYITHFIQSHRLPCNSTTAFLTPVLRNINRPLSKTTALVGRPRELYERTVLLLEAVGEGEETAERMLTDILRHLIALRDKSHQHTQSILARLRQNTTALPLSSDAIAILIQQHLRCKNASRLPVLIVAAAYQAVATKFGESHRPLYAHNAADQQTGAAGDVEITLLNEDQVRTIYEMKQKAVTIDDIDRALQKVDNIKRRVDNYVFITTDDIRPEVTEYAQKLYEQTGGTEFAILDCMGFLRHFLHFFHRHRTAYLDAYQSLVLNEPDSAVSQLLKDVFLTLRLQAEAEN
jgi:hypothetical protein